MPHVLPALRSYNLSQLHVVEHPELGEVPAHTVSKTGMEPLCGHV